MKTINATGLWFLPGRNQEDGIGGILRYSRRSGIRLKLIGSLAPNLFAAMAGADPANTVFGICPDVDEGKYVTLRGCLRTNISLSSGGFAQEALLAHEALVGNKTHYKDDFRISRLELGFDHLGSWIQSTAAKPLVQIKSEGKSTGFILEYELPPKKIMRTETGEIEISSDVRVKSPARRVKVIEETAFWVIKPSTPCVIEETDEWTTILQNFVSFATDSPNAVSFARCHQDISAAENSSLQNSWNIYKQPVYVPKGRPVDLFLHDMLFSFEDIQDRIEEVLRRWLQISAELKQMFAVYFGFVFGKWSYQDSCFQTVLQSLVLYSRSRYPDASASLEGELSWLSGIVGKHQAPLIRIIGSDKTFLDQIAKQQKAVFGRTRADSNEDRGPGLYWLTQKLGFLVKVILMSELNFSKEKQISFLERNRSFAHLAGMKSDV